MDGEKGDRQRREMDREKGRWTERMHGGISYAKGPVVAAALLCWRYCAVL